MHNEIERYSDEFFPSDYSSWRYCIENKCGQALTPEYIQVRIAILSDPGHEESRRFTKLYGKPWREQVLAWFQRAAEEA
jgi:hypothetical protein